jgi:transcription-repair coupling factor (superfamily II helicase)
LLPDWETLPYDQFSPHQDLVSQRLATLHHVSRGECDVLVVAATTALYRLAPPEYLAAFTFFLKQGTRLDIDALRAQLALAGYQHVTQVVSPGEFSVRGGLIDLFPMGSALPYRLDLFDDDIESIKTFDVDTQRTLYPVPDVRLLPAREFPLDEAGRLRFRARYREVFEGDPSRSPLYKDVSAGVVPGGIEYYLPLFFETTATLADYLPRDAVVAFAGNVGAAVQRFWYDTEARYKLMRGDKARPLLPPDAVFLPPESFHAGLKSHARVEISPPAIEAETAERAECRCAAPRIQVDRRAPDPLAALKAYLASTDARVVICAESPGRRETMQQYFAEYGLRVPLPTTGRPVVGGARGAALVVSPLHAGFAWPKARLAFVTEAELYSGVVRRDRRDAARRTNVDAMLRDLSEVRIGDPVVHEQHGIGRYLGLVTMDLGEGDAEFLQLVYANDAKLYVPSPTCTSSDATAAPRLKMRRCTSSAARNGRRRRSARPSRRTTRQPSFSICTRSVRRERPRVQVQSRTITKRSPKASRSRRLPDQQAAIDAVITDLRDGRPMDRLVCGDVGFGKTEVALRAAYVAIADGKQVAVLVPTTLLASSTCRCSPIASPTCRSRSRSCPASARPRRSGRRSTASRPERSISSSAPTS